LPSRAPALRPMLKGKTGHFCSPPCQEVWTRKRPAAVTIDRSPIFGALKQVGPITLQQVRRSAQEGLFNSLIEHHHYLGYTQPVGEHLKYVAWAAERPVACLSFSSAPRHLGPRDRFIGWSQTQRKQQIHLMAYNTRFLVLPWVQVPHLASHVLGRVARCISEDWQQLYRHPIYLLETFIEPGRFAGTCYRAANWICVGQTTGRGKDAPTDKPTRPIKQILVYPLSRDFRRRLRGV
jgi:hypothetical protein